jgi:hypothetical protein
MSLQKRAAQAKGLQRAAVDTRCRRLALASGKLVQQNARVFDQPLEATGPHPALHLQRSTARVGITRSNAPTAVHSAHRVSTRCSAPTELTQEGNLALQPVRVASQAISVERTLWPSFHIVLEAHSNSLSHMLNEQLDPVTNLYRFVSVNSSTGEGVEVELDTRLRGVRGHVS